MKVYTLIENVLRVAGKPIAAHEFESVLVCDYPHTTGRYYVGVTESTLGRRLREMKNLRRVTSKRRDGKAFVEYALNVPVVVDSGHTGGY